MRPGRDEPLIDVEPPPGGPAAAGPGLRLLDLAALIIGYGMAALLVRAFWRRAMSLSTAEALFLAFEYAWLGLAMSGPLVLLIDRRARPARHGPLRYTWAETAWLMIGGYWLGVTLLVAPSRLRIEPILGVFPVLAALGLRFFGRTRPAPAADAPASWTHRAAVGLLLSWPAAWIALILLGEAIL